MPGNRCSNCAAYSLKCTYVETAKVERGHASIFRYSNSSLETWTIERVFNLNCFMHLID
jgi:hypothetical protein